MIETTGIPPQPPNPEGPAKAPDGPPNLPPTPMPTRIPTLKPPSAKDNPQKLNLARRAKERAESKKKKEAYLNNMHGDNNPGND